MRASPALAALMAGSALCLATGAGAQEACDLLQSRSSTVQMTRGGFFNFISEPVFGCDGGVIIRADSAVLDDVSGYTRFVGNFEYRDSAAFMTADRADHFASEGRLIGVGNVHIIDGATGATFEGDSTVLVGSSSRREDGEMTIMGLDGRRAHAVILVSPPAAAPDAAEIPSDSAEAEGDSTVAADSAQAPTDSAEVESDSAEIADSTEAPTDAADVESDPAEVADSPEAPTDSAAVEGDSTEATDSAGAAPDAADSIPAGTGEEEGPSPDPPPRDTTPVPYDIDAERIYLTGADYMVATGSAELYNDEFRALADSIEYREEAGMLFLRGTAPRVYGYGAEYELSGAEVDLDMDGDQVTARGDAALSGSEIDLTAPEIRVLMNDGVLYRIVAMNERPPEPVLPGPPGDVDILAGDSAATVADAGEASADAGTEDTGEAPADADEPTDEAGAAPGEEVAGIRTEPDELVLAEATPGGEAPGAGEEGALQTPSGEPGDSAEALPPARPRAVAETFELEGDSIDVMAPNEVLERVVAVGGARGESLARDSLNTEDTPEIARSDWVSGDTIIAVFRPVAAAETPPEAGPEAVAGEAGGGYQLDHLEARGQAASLYRMTPTGDAGDEEGEQEAEADQEGEGEEIAAEGEGDPAQDNPGEDILAEDIPEESAEQVGEEEVTTEQAGEEEVLDPQAAEDEVPSAQAGEEAGGEEEAAPEPEPDNRLALHYVKGDLITIFMQDGEVTSVIVEGDAQGIQLEPVAPAPAPPDTTAAPPVTRR